MKVAVLAPQLALLAPQSSQKTALWWLSSKTANLANLLKKQAIPGNFKKIAEKLLYA